MQTISINYHAKCLRAPLIGLLVLVCASPVFGAGPDPKEIRPFLEKHCITCHGPETQKGKVRLDTLAEQSPDKQRALWEAALEQLSLDVMPPPQAKTQPAQLDRENAIVWFETALGKSGDNRLSAEQLLELPGFGNRVNHEALFTEPAERRAATPARVWRISPYIYKNAVNLFAHEPLLQARPITGGDGLHPSLPFLTPTHSFRDMAGPHRFEEATTELLVDMAMRVAERQIAGKSVNENFVFVKQAAKPTAAQFEKAIRYQFGLVLQRDPDTEELERLLALAARTPNDAGPGEALQTVLAAVLIKPDAVFRVEAGDGEPDAQGRVMLSPQELAFAISYALTDDLPDAPLREALKAGRLETAQDVAREVQRLLDDSAERQPRTLRFFQEYFEYARASQVFKDALNIFQYLPWEMVNDADRFVTHILKNDRDVLKQLLTSDDYFVMASGVINRNPNVEAQVRKSYLPLYNLPSDWPWTAQHPVKLPMPRSGILTYPAWLLTFSDNEKNQPIQRGHFIRTKLLGGTVPDVPIGVDAKLPNDPELTLREKMAKVTHAEYCWRCHQRMDPLGLPFEQFDDFGRYRTEELGKPVETHGEISIGDPELDGPVKDPFEFMARLAASTRVRQVFVRHAFRYWMGRNETLDDAPTLIDADAAYTKSGGSMKALVVSLLTSDSFLYRRLPNPVNTIDKLQPAK